MASKLSASERRRADPPGRKPSLKSFQRFVAGKQGPLKELQQIIAQAGADPVGAGPRNILPQMLAAQQRREMMQANGLPGAGGAPGVDPATAAIIAKILGANPNGTADGMPGDPENDPNEQENDNDEDD